MYVFFLFFSIKIHDLAELKDMYAIINLDDEHKGITFSEVNWHLIILGRVMCLLMYGLHSL